MSELIQLISDYLTEFGVAKTHIQWSVSLVSFSAILALAWGLYILLSRMIGPYITRFVEYTEVKWDDVIFKPIVLRSIWRLLIAIILSALLPDTLAFYPTLASFVKGVCKITVVIAIMMLIVRALSAGFELFSSNSKYSRTSFKGVCQLLQLLVILASVIIIISIMIGRDPLFIISGLGAMAAVLMLVFQDTILGFIAGVQLTANDMLRPGDWISAPKSNINGIVQEVTLTTVKVQNFDMTIVTIPPYALVKDSFQNWRGMKESGGRRIARSFNIDMTTIRVVSSEEIAAFSSEPWWTDKFGESQPQTKEYVNLTILRRYLEWYVSQQATLVRTMTWMVRELQPTPEGMPIEVYFFTSQQEWTSFELLQAEVMDHIIAKVQHFGLKIFQLPTGADISNLRTTIEKN